MMTSPAQELLLKTTQVAQLLNVHVATVNRLARSGKLRVHARTPGGHALFQYAEVVSYRESLLLPGLASPKEEK